MDFETANEITRALRRLAMLQRGRKSELLRDLGLQPGQDVVLLELARLEQASQITLAQAVEVYEPSVGRSIARLEAKDLVKRRVDPHDSRRRVVELTARGARLIPELEQLYINFAKRAVGEPNSSFHRKLIKTIDETTSRFE